MLELPFLFACAAPVPYVVLGVVSMASSPTMSFVVVEVGILLTALFVLGGSAYLRETAARRDFFLQRIIVDQERALETERAKQLGQYTLEQKLGQGGMGVVYRAQHALLRRPTAVKLLSTDDATPEELACFEPEVQLTAGLNHPNVVEIFDFGHGPGGEFYYAMEHLPGLDLETLVREWGPLPAARAEPILIQVCAALAEKATLPKAPAGLAGISFDGDGYAAVADLVWREVPAR